MRGTRRRALIATLLGILGAVPGVAGIGHVYLREWRRAVAWFTFVLGAFLVLTSIFSDPTSLTPATVPLSVVVPVYGLLSVSVLDAYYLGIRGPSRFESALACPYCGGALDPELDFCYWCTSEIVYVDPADGVESVGSLDASDAVDSSP